MDSHTGIVIQIQFLGEMKHFDCEHNYIIIYFIL